MKSQQMLIKEYNKSYFMDNSLWEQMKSEDHNLPGLFKETLL